MVQSKEHEFKPSYNDIAKLGKVLAHPARVMILHILAKENRCVNDLVDRIPLSQSTISQHLKILKDSGLIDFETSLNKNSYCLNKKKLRQLSGTMDKMLSKVLESI